MSVATSSPRTAAEPMAFTPWEFWRGAIHAWGWFLVISTVAFVPVFFVWALYAFLTTVPWSIGALVVFSPVAWAMGRLLRRIPRLLPHVLAFTLLGAVVGVVTTVVAFHTPGSGLTPENFGSSWPIILVVCVSATIAVPLGWWISARRALRADADAELSRP